MSLMIMLLKKSYRIAERMHSFLSIPVGEDAAQCYASLLQLSIVQFKIFMTKNLKVFKDATLLSHNLQLTGKPTVCKMAWKKDFWDRKLIK